MAIELRGRQWGIHCELVATGRVHRKPLLLLPLKLEAVLKGAGSTVMPSDLEQRKKGTPLQGLIRVEKW